MRWTHLALLQCVAAAIPATGQIIDIDILDAGDSGGPAPTGLLVMDIALDLSDDQASVTGGIVGRSFHNARLVYGDDPNAVFRPPGTEVPFVTFASAGYGRNEPARFSPAGTPSEPGIGLAPYDTSGHLSTFAPDFLNSSYYSFPLPDPLFGRDGYFLRVVLDISDMTIPGADDPGNFRIFSPGTEPPGYLPAFVSDAQVFAELPGTGFRIDPQAAYVGLDWGVYVPEPASGILFLVSSAFLFCCRRGQTGSGREPSRRGHGGPRHLHGAPRVAAVFNLAPG